jgi:hypothetical protein
MGMGWPLMVLVLAAAACFVVWRVGQGLYDRRWDTYASETRWTNDAVCVQLLHAHDLKEPYPGACLVPTANNDRLDIEVIFPDGYAAHCETYQEDDMIGLACAQPLPR